MKKQELLNELPKYSVVDDYTSELQYKVGYSDVEIVEVLIDKDTYLIVSKIEDVEYFIATQKYGSKSYHIPGRQFYGGDWESLVNEFTGLYREQLSEHGSYSYWCGEHIADAKQDEEDFDDKFFTRDGYYREGVLEFADGDVVTTFQDDSEGVWYSIIAKVMFTPAED